MDSFYLSKSSFLKGLQCEKNIYLYYHSPELTKEISGNNLSLFRRSHEIEELARNLFPGGILIESDTDEGIEEKLKRTGEAIEAGASILYQPVFEFERNIAICDITVKTPYGWNIYEVKNSTRISEFNLWDASFQFYVLKNSGIDIRDLSIVHINNSYKRKKDLDMKKLFRIESVLDTARRNESEVKDKINMFRKIVASDTIPNVKISQHCTYPFECGFIDHCWKDIPDHSIFSITNMHLHKKFELFDSGIIKIDELPPYYNLTKVQRIQIDSYRKGKPVIEKEKIRFFLKNLEYPLYFLDFESFQSPVPPFENSKPFQQIPFQYSLHIKHTADSDPIHVDYIAEPFGETRINFIERLTEDLGSSGSILVYNKGFEVSVLNQIAGDFPAYRTKIQGIRSRIVDLMTPFQKKHYYKPEMSGSHSIKHVLPAMVPEMNYDNLAIADGRTAAVTFEALMHESDSDIIGQSIKHLRDYCKMDTLAMVKILEALEKSI